MCECGDECEWVRFCERTMKENGQMVINRTYRIIVDILLEEPL